MMKTLVIVLIVSVSTQAQYFANAIGGGNVNGINATSLSIYVQGIVFDKQGIAYIAEGNNARIVKVDASGKVQVIAGPGATDTSGNGTNIGFVEDIAIGNDGLLYFPTKNTIRKMDVNTGVITIVAGTGTSGNTGDGGNALAANINPFQLVVDKAGNIYFTSFGHHVVRKVDASTGIITTIAGTGARGYSGDGGPATSAQLNSPTGIALDSKGNVYFSDRRNSRIRKIDANTGIITTVTGSGTDDYTGDGGLASAATVASPEGLLIDANDNIYIADYDNAVVRKIDATTGNISTIAGGGSQTTEGVQALQAQLVVYRLGIDNNGNLYVTDDSDYYIKKIDNAGVVTTFSGNGNSDLFRGYWGDVGPATSALFNSPGTVITDASGNVYISDGTNHRVRKIDATTGNISTIAGTGVKGFSGDGGPATAAQINFPSGLVFDTNGNLYIVDLNNHRVRKVDATTGNISTVVGTGVAGFSGDGGLATAAQLNFPRSIAIDGTGNLYIVDRSNHRIRKVDAGTGNISTVAGTGAAGFSGDGGVATSAQLNFPWGVALDASGNIYIADWLNERVRKVDVGTGNISTVVGNGVSNNTGDGGLATAASVNRPRSLAFDASGNMYISTNRTLRKVANTTSNISTISGSDVGSFNGLRGSAINIGHRGTGNVWVDNSGYVYTTDHQENLIWRLRPATSINLKQATATIANNAAQGFGNTVINTPKNLTFTIENTGTNKMFLESITASGDFSIMGTPAKEVNAGANTTITVAMNASSIGAKNGKLVIQSNDNNNDTYTISLSGTVNKADQTITFGSLTSKTFGDAVFNLTATASSGLGVTYASSNTSVATISGNTVTIVGAGTTTITASQAGDANYNAATDVPQTLTVNKAIQTITFGALGTKTFGDAAFTLSAMGGASGNAITYTSSDASVATISGNTVTIVGAGTTTITASQAGDANYNAATNVSQTLTINKANQTITFDLGANTTKIVGDAAFDLTATGGASGSTVTYTSSNTAVATISGSTVTIVGPGTATITASQAGNNNYNAATDVTQTLTVTQPTGIAENLANAQLTLFPNPTVNIVHFRIKGQVSSSEVNITVLDRQGVIVLQSTRRLVNGEMTLPINHLASGYYLFKIKIGEETILRRIIKK
ncbi:hypothetical protein BKI52_20470 [marine bacterium AO1-C]|nr:hypothetical protein BKI52_20470 [marine bacterium AO1-C]